MWRNWSEEWERRKSYLVRSLFEDLSKLSPISEANEPDILSTRAYSPLPDLIIEREKNPHDESDEFYRELQVKMIKLYKKLFHGLEDDSSEETYKLLEFMDDNNILDQSLCDVDIPQINLDTDSSNNDSDASGMNEVVDSTGHDILTESNETTETECSPSLTHEIIITQAIVHVEPTNDDHEDLNNNIIIAHQRISRSISTERSLVLDLKYKKNDFMSSNKDTRQKETDSDRLVETQAKAGEEIKIETRTLDDHEDEIEVMRLATRNTKSLGSVPEQSTTTIEKKSLTPLALAEGRMSMIQYVESSPEIEVDSDSSDENSFNQAFYLNISNSSAGKRTRLSSTFEGSPNKKTRYETISVQTDPIKRTNWEEVKGSFFHGTPLIYNLCHCRNHACN